MSEDEAIISLLFDRLSSEQGCGPDFGGSVWAQNDIEWGQICTTALLRLGSGSAPGRPP